jgi:hypothetical protein
VFFILFHPRFLLLSLGQVIIFAGVLFMHQVAEEEEPPNQGGQVVTEETPDRHRNG